MYTERPSPAVYGIETEYSCRIVRNDGTSAEIVEDSESGQPNLKLQQQPRNNSNDAVPRTAIKTYLASIGIESIKSGMMSNGARLYGDPSGLEYATAETRTAEEATLRSLDGDEVLQRVLQKLQSDGGIKAFQANRHGTDYNRTSRGIHLNTLTSLEGIQENRGALNWLATLNVAKGAMFGAGGLLMDHNGRTAFHHSPRLSITNSLEASAGDYVLRALVRAPFKPDVKSVYRMESITSDALSFAWPIKASLVVTNAVMGLIEMGYGSRLPRLNMLKTTESARLVGRYGYEGMMSLENKTCGRPDKASSLEVLRRYGEIMLEVDEIERHLDVESRQVAHEVIMVADKMEADPYSVVDQVQSMTRLTAIDNRMAKKHLELGSQKIRDYDYMFDWLDNGVAKQLREKNGYGWLGFKAEHSASAEVERRIVTPPQDTRAKLRGDIIKRPHGIRVADWFVLYKHNSRAGVNVHPLQTEMPKELVG